MLTGGSSTRQLITAPDDAVYTKYLGHPVSLFLFRLPASLLTIAFAGQCLLDAELLAWLQIEGVAFDFTDDVLLNNLSFEAAEGVLHGLAFLEPYVSQWHLHPAPIFPLALYGHFRRRSRLALRQLFHQFLAGLEARIPFCGDGDGFPGARVAALALLPLFHHEAAKPPQVYPFVCLERFRDHRQDRVHCHFNLGLLQLDRGCDLLNQLLFCHSL